MARIDQFIFNAIARARNRHYIVVYDISDDRERLAVADLLSSYGVRVQFSVFECRLTLKRHNELSLELEKKGIKTGFIKIYRVEKQTKPLTFGIEHQGNIDLDEACIII